VTQFHVCRAGGGVSLEWAWVRTMYALTFAALGRDPQCVVWALRAFAAYVGALRARIVDVDPLRRWFVVETLYTLGRAYAGLDDGAARAVHYLTVASNLARAAAHQQLTDYPQLIEVSQEERALGEWKERGKGRGLVGWSRV